ncbi:MAG TPA: 50S ribosomal protein L17, partial [Parachlamydiaceae bacterium]|nr:50S ribosomal protein L17 [Parachlamydiaceae bacterium]
SLIEKGRIETTVAKAKALRRHADKMITLAKTNTLAARRRATSELMIRFNPLTSKEARAAKNGDTSSYNTDRQVINQLFTVLGVRFATRNGGYTRIIKGHRRKGDNSQTCIIEYLDQ